VSLDAGETRPARETGRATWPRLRDDIFTPRKVVVKRLREEIGVV